MGRDRRVGSIESTAPPTIDHWIAAVEASEQCARILHLLAACQCPDSTRSGSVIPHRPSDASAELADCCATSGGTLPQVDLRFRRGKSRDAFAGRGVAHEFTAGPVADRPSFPPVDLGHFLGLAQYLQRLVHEFLQLGKFACIR